MENNVKLNVFEKRDVTAESSSVDYTDLHSFDYFKYGISKENISFLPENWTEAKVFVKESCNQPILLVNSSRC